ncbi:MAG: dihydroorotate dehydrogenase electron transfer subunit [Clostridiales bacterium]|jgi:dihydroorotate dehydrogenase electron transfer subunit|nr:dihydroorotate dehydrogenase electron transfer subunit [Clostridiales bacterium]
MRAFDAVILENAKLKPVILSMRVRVPQNITAVPGQFANIYLDRPDMLLPRPISICGLEGDTMRLIYQIAGKGTQYLSELERGKILRMVAPLGNGFNISGFSSNLADSRKAMLIGGGIGAPPLLFLAKMFKSPLAVLGFRSASSIILADEFLSLGCETVVSTDDGSLGYKGRVMEVVRALAPERDISVIYACGPRIMLGIAAEYARDKNIPCQVSMEEHMACGIGACFCCPAPVIENSRRVYKKVCKDGPVFDADSVAWEGLI